VFSKLLKIIKSFSKIERLIFIAALLAFFVAGIFLFIDFVAKQTILTAIAGGEYREGVVGQPSFINPILFGANDVDRDLSEILFSNILNLAESPKISADGKIWNIRLKDGTRWSDDVPITSDDVIFTIETIQDPDARSSLFPVWQGVVAERVSERELRFILAAPYAFFENNLKELKPIPKHIFGGLPAANLRLSSYNLEPVGSGPFRYDSFEKRRDGFITKYILLRNENYSGEKPYLDKMTFRFYENQDELIRAMNSGEIDGFGGVNPQDLKKISVNHEVFEIRMPRYYAAFFNPYNHPALKDKNVRMALSLGLDKSGIIKKVFDNYAISVNGPMIPGMEGYAAKVYPGEDFSPEKAAALLESSGWKLSDEGVIESVIRQAKKDLMKLEFNLVVPQTSHLVETAELIKDYWSKIGVKLNLKITGGSNIESEALRTRNYDMILFGNIFGGNPDLFSFWYSSERFYPGLNLALYENETVDSLIESVRKNLNKESRQADLTSLQSAIVQDEPAIFLFSPSYLYVSKNWLKGFEEKFIPLPSDRFESIEKWYVKTSRKFR